MIEYKAYHKKSLGKRSRTGTARRKGKEKGRPAGAGARFRQFLPFVLALLVLGAAGGAGAAAFAWLGRSPLFFVRAIDINPSAHVTRDDVAGILAGAPRGNIWRLSTGEIGRRLLTHPYVREVSVRKAFPDKLVVRVSERRPVAMVNLDALYYLDEEGLVFKRLTAYDPKELPIVTGFSREDLAARDPVALQNLKCAVDLARRAEAGALRRNVSEVHFDAQEGYSIVTRDAGLRVRLGRTDAQEAMRRVDEAMPKLASLGRRDAVVDLRTEGRIFVRPGD